MPEYRRFISYIYEYQSGRKAKNCGYVKVEIRSGVCRLRLHMQSPRRMADTLRIYAFVRVQEGLPGILLGSAAVRGSICDFQWNGPAMDVADSGYSIDDVRGIWLRGADGENYITVWDDETVAEEQFIEPGARAAAGETRIALDDPAAGQTAPETAVAAAETDEKKPEMSGDEAGTDEKKPGMSGDEPGTDERKPEMSGDEPGTDERKPEMSGDERATDVERAQTDGEELGANGERTRADGEKLGVDAENAQTGGEKLGVDVERAQTDREEPGADTGRAERDEDREEPAPGTVQPQGAVPGSLWMRWENFLNHYPQINPFADGEITQCIAIAPKDISFLQRGEWQLGRSTFVRQAYMRYHHLLLGCHVSGRFVLAVPGTSESQERHMARMYGFLYYKEADGAQNGEVCAAGQEKQAEPQGYWFRFLNEKWQR